MPIPRVPRDFGPMKALIARTACVTVLLLLESCVHLTQSSFLASYDRDIRNSTEAIESARGDAQRAAAFTRRGDAYSEKARYSRAFKLISPEEYARLFSLAIRDHDQAIALDSASAHAYYRRGRTYYDRAVLEVVVNGMLVGTDAARKAWFAPAITDFRKAIEKDPRHDRAWDSLGLSHETLGELDEAISDYTQEMALNTLGRIRLADAYCERGNSNQAEKKQAAAIMDYEKSIDAGSGGDGCSCDPYNPLLALYGEGRQYDQSWAVVQRAWKAGKWIAPDLLAILKKESGRSN